MAIAKTRQQNWLLNKTASVSAKVAKFALGLKMTVARRAMLNSTIYELNTLSDKELADIGIGRSGIRAAAQASVAQTFDNLNQQGGRQ